MPKTRSKARSIARTAPAARVRTARSSSTATMPPPASPALPAGVAGTAKSGTGTTCRRGAFKLPFPDSAPPGRAQLAQHEPQHRAERRHSGEDLEEQRVVDAVATRVRVVDRAIQLDLLPDVLEREVARRLAREQLLERLHEHRQVEVLAVHLAVDHAVRVDDRDLRAVVEALRRRLVGEAEIGGKRVDLRRIGAEEMPVGIVDAVLPAERGHRARVVERLVEADRDDAKAIVPQRLACGAHRLREELRGDRTGLEAARVYEAH